MAELLDRWRPVVDHCFDLLEREGAGHPRMPCVLRPRERQGA